MVDLLERHHQHGRGFEPADFIEEGSRVAVGMTVSDLAWQGEIASGVFKVFTSMVRTPCCCRIAQAAMTSGRSRATRVHEWAGA